MSDDKVKFSRLVSGPYDSPMEEWFLHHLCKYLPVEAKYEDHVRIETACGPFVVDYVVRTTSRAVGFEVDGREFHQDPVRDEFRDAAILATGRLDTIYRLPASALHRYPEDCMLAVGRADPELISDRGRLNLERLAHEDAKSLSVGGNPPSIHLWISPEEDEARARDDEEADETQDEGRPPFVIHIARHRDQLGMAGLISYVREFGPASIEEIRRRAERLAGEQWGDSDPGLR